MNNQTNTSIFGKGSLEDLRKAQALMRQVRESGKVELVKPKPVKESK